MATSILTEVRSDRPKKDGTYAIRLLITHNGSKRHISTPWTVAPQHYRKGKITDYRINDYLHDYIRDLRICIDELGMRAKFMSIDDVVNYIRAREESKKPFSLNFVEYVRAYVNKLRKQDSNTYRTYNTSIQSLVKFVGSEDIDINSLTTRLLQQWVDHVSATSNGRAPRLYHTNLQAMHRRACREFNDEDNGIIRIPYNPFVKVILPKQIAAEKRAVSPELINTIINLPDMPQPRANLSRDVFALSFYLVGMNLADLYDVPASAYADGRLTYKRKKTRTRRADEALISIRVEPEAARLIEKYRAKCGDKLFEFSKRYSQDSIFRSATSYGFAFIAKALNLDSLTLYAARHSWATIAVNDVGIDKYTVHEALNHVDPTMKVTDMYIKKDFKRVDEANRAVIDYVSKFKPNLPKQ